MRVALDGGQVIALGTTEAAPTIGIIDYSRRVTDDFGVTTVVERGFARRMTVRLAVPTAEVDALQRRLADLRATPAQWIADERFDWLSFRGFYKDFDIDVAVPPLSFCRLTVESLAGTEVFTDDGSDPAPIGQASTLRVLQPVDVTGSALLGSSVLEDDYPAWSGAVTYPTGARVIVAATHRIYESLVAGNVGANPVSAPDKWLNVGPTNRWAMFDGALGSETSAAGSIAVVLDVGTIDAVALLDVTGLTVRVQATGYDQTRPAGPGAVTFLDLPETDAPVTVTISGSGTVSVGTLLIGTVARLGITEAAPTAGITDFSRKDVDDFGGVSVVQRAWAKRMTARALIRADALDAVAGRIAAVRARASLWIGGGGLDSLTIYGFFKEFSIEAGQSVSKLSLSIEGLSTAGKVGPLRATIDWEDIGDPDGTKPDDNATVGAPIGTGVGGRPVQDLLASIDFVEETLDEAQARVAAALGLVDERLDNPALPDALERLAEQQGRAMEAVLAAQLLAQDRKAQFLGLTHLGGQPIGAVVRREITERVDGQRVMAGQIELIGAATILPDGSTAAASILRLDEAIVDEGLTRATALTAVTASVTTLSETVTSEVTRLDKAVVDEAGARATALAAVTASVTTLADTVTGEVIRLDEAVADENSARTTAIATVTASVATLAGTVTGEVTRLDEAVADEAGARTTAIATVAATVTTLAGTVTGEVTRLDEAVADESSARTTAVATVAASVATLAGTVTGEVTRLDEAVADESSARTTAIATVTASVTTLAGTVSSEVTRLDEAVADEAGARSTALTAVSTSIGGLTSSVSFLIGAINGEEAFAQLLTNVNGKVTGFVIDGVESAFAIAADRLIIGADAAFEVVGGVTYIRNARIRELTVDNMGYGSAGARSEYLHSVSYGVPSGGFTSADFQPVMALNLKSERGDGIEGFGYFVTKSLTGGDGDILVRVSRTVGGVRTSIFGGDEGIPHPANGTVNMPIFDSMEAGTTGQYDVEVRCPTGNFVDCRWRRLKVQELDRSRVQQLEIYCPAGTGPGAGTGGGGNVNGNDTTTPAAGVTGTVNPAPTRRSGYNTYAAIP